MAEMTDGSDLIFATGAPGSKWSRVLSILSHHQDINSSDKEKFPTYSTEATFPNGKTKKVGMHSSAYFGPGNGIGEDFHLLKKLTKESFIQEVSTAFDDFDSGIKIIKSHWFSYNLDWLKDNFPKAKFIFVYNGNEEAFKWWHLVGGWNIKFPNYSWYETNERLYERICVENRLMLDFMKRNKISFNTKDFHTLINYLGLGNDLSFYNELKETEDDLAYSRGNYTIGTVVGAYNPDLNINDNLNESLDIINSKIRLRHQSLGVDEMLINSYGKDWYNTIQGIIESGERSDEN
jgi:hypothetical protein